MPEKPTTTTSHLSGETLERALMTTEPSAVDTFGGKVFVRWDPDANVTGFGPAAYFIEFLKTNGLWERWVEDCPLSYTSPNAPPKQDILGTVMLSVLAGHKRYAHITTVRSDNVLPQLLGMKRVRTGLDEGRCGVGRPEQRTATEWVEPGASRSDPAPPVAGSGGGQRRRKAHGPARLQWNGGTEAWPGSV